MFSIGCIQAMKCNKNTCPTGITPHNKRLQKGLDPQSKSLKAASYATNMTKEVEIIARSCGVTSPMLLKPYHVRIVQSDGVSVPLSHVKVHITGEEGEAVPTQH
jgi:glutamate synthase domain-containing protein 2